MENDMAIQKIKLPIGTVYQKEPNGVYYFRFKVNGDSLKHSRFIRINPNGTGRFKDLS